MRQNPHVRICGGPGSATTLVYPTGFRRVQGCQDMPALVAALRAGDARLGLGESSEMVA